MLVKTALIGCGYWGSKLKKYVEANGHFNLKYVCDINSDLNKVWNDKDVTAVVVATPNKTHYKIVKLALIHGKNVLSEKPLTLKTKECRELKKIASDNGLVLLTEYTYTFSKALDKARKLIGKGEIGKILGIEMAVRHLGRFGGGSVYWLLGSHMLSVLDMFVPLKGLSFKKTDLVVFKGQVETGVISFRGKISGQIFLSLNHPKKETKVIIYGEKGTMIYNPVSQPTLFLEKYERLRWTVDLPRQHKNFYIDEKNNLKYAIEYFYEALVRQIKGNINRAISITKILSKF